MLELCLGVVEVNVCWEEVIELDASCVVVNP